MRENSRRNWQVFSREDYPPLKLTASPWIFFNGWKLFRWRFLLKWSRFREHVNFRGGIISHYKDPIMKTNHDVLLPLLPRMLWWGLESHQKEAKLRCCCVIFNLNVTHRIHGTGIFTYIYHKNQPNVGKSIPYFDCMGYVINCNMM